MSIVARTLWDGKLIWMVEEGFERIQITPSAITGEQLESALRSIQLQLIEWSAQIIHPWSVGEQEFPLTEGQQTITLPRGALGVAEATYRDRLGLDTPVHLLSREEWARLPDKNVIGARPTQLWVNKQHPVGGTRQLTAYLWQQPGHDAGSLMLNLIMVAQNADSLGEEPEIPHVWFEAMCAALAHRLAEKFKPEREAVLHTKREMKFEEAKGATAERRPLTLQWEPRHRHG